ncbi:site-specific DNA-methyltransferase [Varibaculum cambriense]|uniref:Site-specific DNA-methyltransferase n=1 Tax=Varibaculum cambriense TaxID=184870 RepID=A0ABX4USJ6_9ACTO|nr:site-specific DNA-methyltransferase [Varibaculum cambriense]MBS5944189.1 site-specific DNA-methyltransferase [Varibaculum cambriense]PMB90941.1 site-specific DNA-methyltransferase [Varibaculum cambriense]
MTDMINKVPDTTPDFTTEAANNLAELFPEIVADGKVDIEKLKTILGVDVDDARERFGLTWPGKTQAIRAAQAPTTATLLPDKENSNNWDTTQNVFVEGDNLEVLKILQKHYYGQIKMIYIDPPYNTGKDFVYSDNYADSIGSYLELTGQTDEGGKLSTNSESTGRFHSNWLNMMYPRLKLARNLLTANGSIAISIGDAEIQNLIQIADEIFGEKNRVAVLGWKKRGTGGQVARNAIVKQVEYVLLYAKNGGLVELSGPPNEDSGKENWRDFRKSGGQWQREFRPNQHFAFWLGEDGDLSLEETPGSTPIYPKDANGVDGFWENGIETTRERLSRGDFRVRESKQGLKIDQREFAKDTSNAGSFLDIPSTRGTDEIKAIFGDNVIFENPKPVDLITQLLQLSAVSGNDYVLDFFAGSGTTAHAVMQLNAEDGENRRCISVQLPEPTGEKSEARKAEYETISQIARERIRRAGAKIFEDESGKLDGCKDLDVGFRAYKLVDTNFTKWKADSGLSEDELVGLFSDLADSANDHARPEALLTEVLLKLGFSLTERIETVEVAGLSVFSVADGLVMAYLDEHTQPTLDQLRALVAEEPERLVVLEDAFQGHDELKTNLVQECRTRNVDLWTA